MSSSSHSHNHTHHISTTTTTPSTKGNGNTQACAACKYQRRKCAPDCILAPYFPHDRQRQFLNAHKLFGVSNITKIIKHLDQPDKDEAMRTIIFQSDVRANDPVGGCYRIIREMQHLIEYNKAELDIILHQLAICRAQAQQVHQQQHQNPIQMPEIGDQNTCDLLINGDPLSLCGNPMGHFHYIQQPQPPHHAVALQQEQPQEQQQQLPYVFVQNNANSNNNSDNNNGGPHAHPHHQHLHEDVSIWAMQDSMSSLDIKQCGGGMNGIANGCEDLKPFLDQMGCGDDHDRNNGEVVDINGDHQHSEEALLRVHRAS
ncbi:hypothetical protein ACFX13_025426 [Malus domestica]|uniref:LOB domain-containing protein 22 isoform X1 n=1 Tax=Malus domestica TaxID=3750 RepID=UPI000498F346|nr:LOB domain-containing protein 22 [Malus domestica]